ncbi:MAG: UDP-N-acetylmuramate--L-alanine ligase [Pyramidobacter sp.]|nr:UDP-N-acetylmuramate--L-alanine ligase [Pyramidobacter sp.]
MDHQKVDLNKVRNIHLMGVGGAGMSGLALLFHELGFNVSGCDMGRNTYAEKIERAGVKVLYGHDVCHLDDCKVDLMAYSSAIPADNAELCEARRRGIPVLQRAELLSLLFDSRTGIGVAGTHGKTTTTSMISYILEQAEMHPTIAVGGELCDIGCNAKIGTGEYMVAELDESDGSFEFFHPYYSVVTNVDWDHVNHYPSLQSVIDAFARFLHNTKDGGRMFVCGDDSGVKRVLAQLPQEMKERVALFGRDPSFDYYAADVQFHCGGGLCYTLYAKGRKLGTVELVVSGEHNVIDSLAACGVACELGVPFPIIQKAMRMFHGAKRRLQLRAMCPENILVYDDYGHHPREMEATLNAVRTMYPDRRILLVFQPHRYTRTQALFDRFARVLSSVEQTVLLPIYAADEKPIPGVSSDLISAEVGKLGGQCHPVPNKVDAVEQVLSLVRPDDLILTEGAGDVCVVGDMLVQELNRRPTSAL